MTPTKQRKLNNLDLLNNCSKTREGIIDRFELREKTRENKHARLAGVSTCFGCSTENAESGRPVLPFLAQSTVSVLATLRVLLTRFHVILSELGLSFLCPLTFP